MISSWRSPSAASRALRPLRALCDAETLHAIAHGAAGDAQQLGGCRAVVAGLLERFEDRFFFDAVQILLQGPLTVAALGWRHHFLGFRRRELQIGHGDALAV